MTIITRTLATLLATAVIAFGSLTGCTAQGDNLMPCALDPANAARFTCGDTDYTVLDDAASAEEIGTRIGALHVNAAVDAQGRIVAQQSLADTLKLDMSALADAAANAVGIVSFVNVYEPAAAASAARNGAPAPLLIVDVNGAQHRAIPTAELTADERPLDPVALATAATDAPSSFSVDPDNAARIVTDRTTYEVSDQPAADETLGDLLGMVAASVTYEVDTLRPLTHDELTALDWSGENADERAARFYGEVRALADTDFSQAIAVEVDGVFCQAFAR